MHDIKSAEISQRVAELFCNPLAAGQRRPSPVWVDVVEKVAADKL